MGKADEQDQERNDKQNASEHRIGFRPSAERVEPLLDRFDHLEKDLPPAGRLGELRAVENFSSRRADSLRRRNLIGLKDNRHR